MNAEESTTYSMDYQVEREDGRVREERDASVAGPLRRGASPARATAGESL